MFVVNKRHGFNSTTVTDVQGTVVFMTEEDAERAAHFMSFDGHSYSVHPITVRDLHQRGDHNHCEPDCGPIETFDSSVPSHIKTL